MQPICDHGCYTCRICRRLTCTGIFSGYKDHLQSTGHWVARAIRTRCAWNCGPKESVTWATWAINDKLRSIPAECICSIPDRGGSYELEIGTSEHEDLCKYIYIYIYIYISLSLSLSSYLFNVHRHVQTCIHIYIYI